MSSKCDQIDRVFFRVVQYLVSWTTICSCNHDVLVEQPRRLKKRSYQLLCDGGRFMNIGIQSQPTSEAWRIGQLVLQHVENMQFRTELGHEYASILRRFRTILAKIRR